MVSKLGPNALDLSLEEFRALLKGRRGAIKAFLLDQDRIAGIGNVYVQTPLWRAKIHPLRPIPSLSDEEIATLWQALREVLQGSTSVPAEHRRGIDAGGAPFELNLYGRKGGWDDPLPVPLGGRGTLPGVRDAVGQDPHGEHGKLYLPGVPAAQAARPASLEVDSGRLGLLEMMVPSS